MGDRDRKRNFCKWLNTAVGGKDPDRSITHSLIMHVSSRGGSGACTRTAGRAGRTIFTALPARRHTVLSSTERSTATLGQRKATSLDLWSWARLSNFQRLPPAENTLYPGQSRKVLANGKADVDDEGDDLDAEEDVARPRFRRIEPDPYILPELVGCGCCSI